MDRFHNCLGCRNLVLVIGIDRGSGKCPQCNRSQQEFPVDSTCRSYTLYSWNYWSALPKAESCPIDTLSPSSNLPDNSYQDCRPCMTLLSLLCYSAQPDMANKYASLGRLLSGKSQVGKVLELTSNYNVNNAKKYLLFLNCHKRILLRIVYKKSVLSDR